MAVRESRLRIPLSLLSFQAAHWLPAAAQIVRRFVRKIDERALPLARAVLRAHPECDMLLWRIVRQMAGAMLVTRVGGVACALPIAHVVETMRPLPVEPFRGASDNVLAALEGLAMIRGAPVPVVDARKLLGVPGDAATRFVILRIEQRRVALAVDAVLDVRQIEVGALPALAPLLGSAQGDVVSAIGVLDAEMLIVLESARVLSDDAWRALERGGAR
jgi:purine-binding chemotaxis protein CheW